MLINGNWTEDWQPVQAEDEQGRFIRQTSSFRHWITADGQAGPTGTGGFKAEKDRYHLYVALICPWGLTYLDGTSVKRSARYNRYYRGQPAAWQSRLAVWWL